MIECQQLGLTKSIGVSNFNQRQLQTLIDGSSVAPANVQVRVEFSFVQFIPLLSFDNFFV